MSRLQSAMTTVCRDLTVDDLSGITGTSRATAARWLKALREDENLDMWSAQSVEDMAQYEAREKGTTEIIDALRPPELSDGGTTGAPEVRMQMAKASRKSSSLVVQLEAVDVQAGFDVRKARELVSKAEEVMHETNKQLQLLTRWRLHLLSKIICGHKDQSV